MNVYLLVLFEKLKMEMGTRSFGDLIELVRQGYKTACIPYNEQKDTSVLDMPIFIHFLRLATTPGVVAELGKYSLNSILCFTRTCVFLFLLQMLRDRHSLQILISCKVAAVDTQ